MNIGGENHKQVVARIKSRDFETILLVADSGCDLYHKERAIVITNSLPSVIKLSNDEEEEEPDGEEVLDTRLQTVTFREFNPAEESEKVSESTKDREGVSVRRQESVDSGVAGEAGDGGEEGDGGGGLAGLGLTVQQMKEKLRRRRRHDPRLDPRKRQSGDWWSQYKMIQTL